MPFFSVSKSDSQSKENKNLFVQLIYFNSYQFEYRESHHYPWLDG